MKIGTEKALLEVNKESMIEKIKRFFNKLFKKENIKKENEAKTFIKKEEFIENIKKIEDDETILLKLQQKYRKGEIKAENLTEEQINLLCKLYDKQIVELRQTNEMRKKRIREYKKNKDLVLPKGT